MHELARAIQEAGLVTGPEAERVGPAGRIDDGGFAFPALDDPFRRAGAEHFTGEEPAIGRIGQAVGEGATDVDQELPAIHRLGAAGPSTG